MTATCLALALASFLASVPPASSPVDVVAHEAPRLPDWLPAPEPFVRVDSLHDVAGLRIALDGTDGREHVFFVLDWAWVRLADGRAITARLELVDEQGEISLIAEPDASAFAGAVPIETFSDLMGVDVVSVTDENGVIRHVAAAAFGLGGAAELGPGEIIVGGGACWLKPIHACPLSSPDCKFNSGCLPAPDGGCVCFMSDEPGKLTRCHLEVVGHACVQRPACTGQCVSPCVCKVSRPPEGGER